MQGTHRKHSRHSVKGEGAPGARVSEAGGDSAPSPGFLVGNTIMTSQPVPNETVIVLPSNVINFSQAEKPELTNQGQDSLKTRLQAEVKVIGTIQILCGVKVLSLGIILASASFSPNFTQVISTLLKSAYPFIAPLLFVISGSLSIITEKRLTKLLVHSSLAGSILSALSALGTLSLMLICTLLEFCLAVLTAVLRWKQTVSDFPGVCFSCLTVTPVPKDDS
ncbi:membrane-spanning 4-domains subfamily A member 6A-like isoform X2 [Macaca nemestrina]|uniref:membrane-spanning 4-domains subfamily A member 6A-like isoform X2 n=1 Tax=Macaca nemestrina TaxID=9545 RepID=UPI0039B8D7B2